MRRIKLKLSPSLEQEDITQTLEDALQEEKGEVSTDVTPTENTDQSTEVTEVAETETSITDTDPADNEVIDNVTDVVVDASEGVTSESPAANFASKIKDSFDAAVEKGFTGTFDDFLVTLTDNITQKESSSDINSNALGTTDGTGDVVEPESKVAEIEETAETDDTIEEETAVSETEEVSEPEEEEESEEAPEASEEVNDVEDTVDEVTEEIPADKTDEAPDTTDETPESDTTEEVSEEEPVSEEPADTNLNGEEVPEGEGEEETPKADEVEDPEGTDDESLTEYAEEIVGEEEEEEDDEMVEEALDTSERLGRIAEIVKEAAEEAKEGDDDDVNESLAKIAELATECLQDKVGIAPSERVTFSNESFNDKAGVMYRYETSLESIKDTVKAIYDSIIKYIKKLIDTIKEFTRKSKIKLKLTISKTKKLLNSVREKKKENDTTQNDSNVKEKTEKVDDPYITDQRLKLMLMPGGEVVDNYSKKHNKDLLMIREVANYIHSKTNVIFTSITDFMKSLGNSDLESIKKKLHESEDQFFDKIPGFGTDLINSSSKNSLTIDRKYLIATSDILFDNHVLAVTLLNFQSTSKNINLARFKSDDLDDKVNKAQIKKLEPSEAKDIATASLNALYLMEKTIDKYFDETEKQLNTISSEIAKLKAANNESPESKETLSKMNFLFRFYSKMTARTGNAMDLLLQETQRGCTIMNNYIKASN